MDFNQALTADVSNLTEQQAVEAFNVLFEEGDGQRLLDNAHEDFEVATNAQLPGVLAQSAQLSEDAGNSDGADIFNRMRELVLAFPNADYSA